MTVELHRHSERIVADPDLTLVLPFLGYFPLEGDSTATQDFLLITCSSRALSAVESERMNQEILPFLLGLSAAMGWLVLMVPLAYRIWGISVPLNPLKRRREEVSETFLLDGLLVFGMSMFTFDQADRYFRWVLYARPADRPNWATGVDALFSCILAGVLFGLFEGFRAARSEEKERQPK